MNPITTLLLLLSSLFLLHACSTTPQHAEQFPASETPPAEHCPPCESTPPAPEPPAAPPVSAAPYRQALWSELPDWGNSVSPASLYALQRSCKKLQHDPTWHSACLAILRLDSDHSDNTTIRLQLEQHFSPWRLVQPDAQEYGMITGYYEPLLDVSRQASAQYRWPVHGRPSDLLPLNLNRWPTHAEPPQLRARWNGKKIQPYWTRAEIMAQGNRFNAPVLMWAKDPVALFFLQIQGSGQAVFSDNTKVRIGFADHNGHPYRSIGRWLIQQQHLPADKASMEGIKQWLAQNPQRLNELLNINPRYIFFKEYPVDSGGPLGAQGVPLMPQHSIAVDPAFIPLGAPVYLSTTYPNSSRPLNRLMVAQDTGSAIKGPVRADFFWGTGTVAGQQAGKMKQQGALWVLLPQGTTPQSR